MITGAVSPFLAKGDYSYGEAWAGGVRQWGACGRRDLKPLTCPIMVSQRWRVNLRSRTGSDGWRPRAPVRSMV